MKTEIKEQDRLQPVDVVVLLKLISVDENTTDNELGTTLLISEAEIRKSLDRSVMAGLLARNKRTVMRKTLYEFIVYGLKCVFPVRPGERAIGVPTGYSAPVLSKYFIFDSCHVWPSDLGQSEGETITPFYPGQPQAALNDSQLYDLLSLIDTMRAGRARGTAASAHITKKTF